MTSLIGFNSATTDTVATGNSGLTSGRGFSLGDRHMDHQGNEWVYVKASAAFTLGDCVAIKSGYKGSPMTDALSKTCQEVGVASAVAFTIDYYGWVQTRGAFANLRVAIDCEPAKPLYITGTAGVLDDATLSSMIQGIQITTSATAAGAFPAIGRPAVNWGANLNQI
jgi:hypothetical protein